MVEAAHRSTADNSGEIYSSAFTPEIITPTVYSHPLQERIAKDWRPLLLENGEGCPSRRVEVFKDTVEKFGNLVSNLSQSELDGDMDKNMANEVMRKANYVKATAIDVLTSMKIDVGSFAEHKTMSTMQQKYPPDLLYGLIRSGMPSLEAMAYVKQEHADGNILLPIAYQMTGNEWGYRAPRDPAFKDAHQDIADIWQRRAFGMYLRASERLPNLFGESQEFIQEFDEMSPEEINALAKNDKIITADEKPGTDPLRNKLISIGGEGGDVVIGVDGFAAGLNRDQQIDSNIALKRMILKYRKTKKLVGLGIPEPEAMRLQREVEYRRSRGLSMPFIKIPAAAAILLS